MKVAAQITKWRLVRGLKMAIMVSSWPKWKKHQSFWLSMKTSTRFNSWCHRQEKFKCKRLIKKRSLLHSTLLKARFWRREDHDQIDLKIRALWNLTSSTQIAQKILFKGLSVECQWVINMTSATLTRSSKRKAAFSQRAPSTKKDKKHLFWTTPASLCFLLKENTSQTGLISLRWPEDLHNMSKMRHHVSRMKPSTGTCMTFGLW